MENTKGSITNIQYFSLDDGPGVRTTVFFKGCPLRCKWCHNPENLEYTDVENISNSNTLLDVRRFSVAELLEKIKKDTYFYGVKGGVTFSGGEPLLQYDFLKEVLEECKKENITTAIETSMYSSYEKIYSLLPLLDFWMMDLKIIDSKKHLYYTGVQNELIKKNILEISKERGDFTIRIPLINGVNTTEKDLYEFADFIEQIPLRIPIELIPYHKYGEGKYDKLGMDYTIVDGMVSIKLVEKIKKILSEGGRKVSYKRIFEDRNSKKGG